MLQSYDDISEPKLEELLNQLKEISGSLGHWLIDHLTGRLSSLSAPDDLFSFFTEMRGQFLVFFNTFCSVLFCQVLRVCVKLVGSLTICLWCQGYLEDWIQLLWKIIKLFWTQIAIWDCFSVAAFSHLILYRLRYCCMLACGHNYSFVLCAIMLDMIIVFLQMKWKRQNSRNLIMNK